MTDAPRSSRPPPPPPTRPPPGCRVSQSVSQPGGPGAPRAPHNGAAAPSPSAAPGRRRRRTGTRNVLDAAPTPAAGRPRVPPRAPRGFVPGFPGPRPASPSPASVRPPPHLPTRNATRARPPRPGVSPRRRRSHCHWPARRGGDRVPPALPRLSALLGSF